MCIRDRADVVFDESGLIPAIAQDADNGQIMMVAWMNRESLAETAATGRAVYWLSLIHI